MAYSANNNQAGPIISDVGSMELGAPDQSCPKLLLSGLDSLYVSFYLDTVTCSIDWEDLAYLKEKCGRDRGDKFAELTLGTETFAVQPFGKHPYTYILKNRAFEVRLSERLHPSCYVQFFSEALWTQGVQVLRDRFQTWCDSIGLLRLKPESISRTDWAFDYHLPCIDFTPEHFVSRATKDATWREHNAVQTVQFGQGSVVLRVYDKVAEIEQQSDKSWFFQLWGQRQDVWRIEFQVRGERLKKGGIRTLTDLQDLSADLLRELAISHTSLRCPNGDGNRSRWPLHPLWAQLLRDIASLPQTGLCRSYDEKSALAWRLDRNVKSVVGYLKNMASIEQVLNNADEPPSLDEIIGRLTVLSKRHHSDVVWRDDVKRKVKEIELGQ